MLGYCLAFPDGLPSFYTLLSASKPGMRVHAYIFRYPIQDVPSDEEASHKFCEQVYQKMDDALEYHAQHQAFDAPQLPEKIGSVFVCVEDEHMNMNAGYKSKVALCERLWERKRG